MYKSIHDLPFVCQLNLPESALHVYREAFNQAWLDAEDNDSRFATAQNHAWSEVRAHFQRDRESQRWVARPSTREPRPTQRFAAPAILNQIAI